MKRRQWLPYTSEDYKLSLCRERAQELRQSSEFARVQVRKKHPEVINGEVVEYGRIYVQEA